MREIALQQDNNSKLPPLVALQAKGYFGLKKTILVEQSIFSSHTYFYFYGTILSMCIIQPFGRCVATWFAMSQSLVKLTEIETSWGRSKTVT